MGNTKSNPEKVANANANNNIEEQKLIENNLIKEQKLIEKQKELYKNYVNYENEHNVIYEANNIIRFYPVKFVEARGSGDREYADIHATSAYYTYDKNAVYISINTNITENQMILLNNEYDKNTFETDFPKPDIEQLNNSINLLTSFNDKTKLRTFFNQAYNRIFSNYKTFYFNYRECKKTTMNAEIMNAITKKYEAIIEEIHKKTPITILFVEEEVEEENTKGKNTAEYKIEQETIINYALKELLNKEPVVIGGKRRTRKNKKKTK